MTNTSKVKNVQGNGTYDSQYGTLYKFDYELENGQHISANHKSQTPFKKGDTVEYNVKGNANGMDYGTVSKPSNNNGFNSNSKNNSSSSFALSYAKDLAVAHIEKGTEFKAEQILQVATKFNNWLKENA